MAKVLTEYVIPALHHSLYYFISYKEQLLQLGSHQALVGERGEGGRKSEKSLNTLSIA